MTKPEFDVIPHYEPCPSPEKIQPVAQIRRMGVSTNNCMIIGGEARFLGSTTITLTDEYPRFPIPVDYVDGRFTLTDMCDETQITVLENQPVRTTGSYVITMKHLSSFRNCPRDIGVHCILQETKIAEFDHAPDTIGMNLVLTDTSFRSLSGIHETAIKDTVIRGKVVIHEDTTNILGLALMPGVMRVGWSVISQTTSGSQSKSVIIDVSHRDVIRFQDELLELGLVNQARL